MRKHSTILIMIAMFLALSTLPVSARSAFDIALRSATLYDVDTSVAEDSFFSGMSEGKNWTIGVGLDMRLTAFHLSLLASSNHEDEEAFDIYSSLAFDIPVINDVIYLTAGAGITTRVLFPEVEGERLQYNGESSAEETDFMNVLLSSPVHFTAGVDIVLGHATLSLAFIRQGVESLQERYEGTWSGDGKNLVSIGLNLSVL